MGITASTGITSGIDYAALIEGLMKLERQPITLMENRQSRLESTKSALSTLASKLNELKSAADALKTEAGFKIFNTSVSDTTTFTASADSTASAGTYKIRVEALAQKHSIAYANSDIASSTQVIGTGAGTFKFTVAGGAEQTVSIDAATTLQGLADSINALNAGATASIINTGSAYKLILKSNTEGASNGIAITNDDTTLNMDVGANVTTLQAAQDATIKVDGLTVTRASNTITDVIDGVTINLLKTDAGVDKTLTVTRDADKIKENITALVQKYNEVMDYIKANNKYDSKTRTKGTLYAETVTLTVMEKLRSTFQSSISGLPDGDPADEVDMNQLFDAGISIDSKGKLSLDSTKLADAISNNFNDVVNLFIDGATTDGFGKTIYDAVDMFTNSADGLITKRTQGYGNTISNLQKSIDDKEDKLSRYQETLRLRFAALETMVTSLRNQQNFLAGALGG